MQLRPNVSAEKVGDHWLVVSHRDNTAHHLSGPAATVIDCVTSGHQIPAGHDDAVTALITLGILEPTSGWSRRQVITTAAAATTIGVASVALPTAALASSSGPKPGPDPDPPPSGPDPDPPPDPDLGKTWSGVSGVTLQAWSSVAYGNGVWIAVTSNTTNSPDIIRSTDNGATWSGVDSPVINTTSDSPRWGSVAYSSGRWVAVASGTGSKIITSTNDGESWVEIGPDDGYTETAQDPWSSIASNGKGTWIAVANNSTNANLISTDNGESWGRGDAGATATNSGQLQSVAFGMVDGQEGWVAVGNSWRIVTSTDGTSWSMATNRPATPSGTLADRIRSVAYGNGRWVAVAGNGGVLTSTDGNTWTFQKRDSGDWQSVAFGNGVWVAVAMGGTPRAITSADGEEWTNVAVDSRSWRSVAYGNGIFVAVASAGGSPQIMRSPAITP